MAKPTLIFFGNSKYSKIGLEIIQTSFFISLILTIPDSPVKQFGNRKKIPVLETNQLNNEIVDKISSLKPDFLIVEDYGLILPDRLLSMPKFAPLNIHHSLLPKYRGPSPAPTAILNGEKISGVTIIEMTSEVDAGNILTQKAYKLAPDETTDSLLIKLNKMGGELAVEVIKQYLKGTARPKKQDPKQATHTKFISKKDGYFDISNPPDQEKFDRMIRAYYPWPNVWTRLRQDYGGQALKGKIVKFYPGGLIQMEGKKIMPLKDFLNGYPNFPLKIMLLQ